MQLNEQKIKLIQRFFFFLSVALGYRELLFDFREEWVVNP